MPERADLSQVVGEVISQCLAEGVELKLDGLGVFRRGEDGEISFVPATAPRIFIAYVSEDFPTAAKLYNDLSTAGFSPWLDRMKLLPGQNWRAAIDRAMETCDFFIACFSRNSVRKRGQFPYEVRCGLRISDRMPLDDVFLLPVRFDPCEIPQRIASQTQYVDLFPDWDKGSKEVIAAIRAEWPREQRPKAA